MTGPGRMIPAIVLLVSAGCSNSLPSIELAPSTPGSTTTQGGDRQRPIRLNTAATTEQLFAEAQRSAGMGNLGGAAALLEDVVKREPSNRDALVMLAAVDQARANSLDRTKSVQPIRRSAETMRQVRTKFKELNDNEAELLRKALFNDAVVSAAEGKTENALATLEEAVGAGFASLDLLKTDKGLDAIRQEVRFQELLKKVDDLAHNQVKSRVKTLFEKTMPFTLEFSLPDLEGKMVSSADFRGKVLIVDFWGTWCPPCRREIPHFIELLKAHQANGLQVVGINYEQVSPEKVKETIEAFVKENQVPYPCLIGDDKTQAKLGDFEGYPTTLFIDRSGKVRAKLVGLFNLDDSISRLGLEEIVKTLLAEKAPKSSETP